MKQRVTLDDLTVGEVEELEEMLGLPLSQLSQARGTTSALITIVKRRTDPTYTREDAKREKLADFDFGGDVPDPTVAVNGAG